MAVERDRPYASHHFRVGLGGRGGASTRAQAGFSEVILPRLAHDRVHNDPPPEFADSPALLVLRRGFAGSLDLYQWWDQQRQPKRSRGRTVTVELLGEPSGEPVTTWRFVGCRPVALDYSPLNALESAIMIETISLTFDDVVID